MSDIFNQFFIGVGHDEDSMPAVPSPTVVRVYDSQRFEAVRPSEVSRLESKRWRRVMGIVVAGCETVVVMERP